MPLIVKIILIIVMIIGIALTVIGVLIWKKKILFLLHPYHTQAVEQINKKAYAIKVGQGIVIIGKGTFLTGLLYLWLERGWVWYLYCLFIVGIFVLIRATLRYNGKVI